jgi:hypothetical protein
MGLGVRADTVLGFADTVLGLGDRADTFLGLGDREDTVLGFAETVLGLGLGFFFVLDLLIILQFSSILYLGDNRQYLSPTYVHSSLQADFANPLHLDTQFIL